MDWNELKENLEKNGHVLTVSMEQLRDAIGANKLGIHVRAEISRTLAGMGLGHVPQELPTYQHESVRLYKRGTPVGEFIEIVLAPGPQHDAALIQKFGAGGPDYAIVIQKIRELVSE